MVKYASNLEGKLSDIEIIAVLGKKECEADCTVHAKHLLECEKRPTNT